MTTLVPGKRNPQRIDNYYYSGDYLAQQSHDDVCLHCNNPLVWYREADAWEEDENGIWQPLWNAWYAECEHCCVMWIDPIGDGLLRVTSMGDCEDGDA
jgi:hypothetical protein